MTAPVRIHYVLDINPAWEAQAGYALDLLFEGIGVAGLRVFDPSQADLVYSYAKPEALANQAVWVRADQIDDWNYSLPKISSFGTLPILSQTREADVPDEIDGHIAGDIVYSAYALATGALEQHQHKNPWGVPIYENSLFKSSGLLAVPVIALYVNHLAAKLGRKMGRELDRVPRWPSGKKYSIVLSHDVDVPFARAPWNSYFHRLSVNLSQSDWRAAARSFMGLAKRTAQAFMEPSLPAERDPNFCFEKWMELEQVIRTKSCFYIAVTSCVDPFGSLQDVAYSFRHPAMLNMMRKAVSDGWEIGLHASINARQDPKRFRVEKELLESELDGYQLKGLRHHYWAMDSELPERTLWGHAAAGFEYDTSFGINDSPGFRRGMIWPFRPFDRERSEGLPLLEIPPTLMDGAIFYHKVAPDEGYRKVKAHVRQVFDHGGAVVLDWHLEQLNPKRLRGAGPVLARVLSELSEDSSIFWTSPAGLASWWQTRCKRLSSCV